MPVLFAFTLFVSATLLFLVQPMIAKMILPKLGGTPAVWNTCMVFFQAALLAGYSYAHVTTTLLGARRQAILHCLLLSVPLLVLPITVAEDWAPPEGAHPALGVLGLLLIVAGLPFFLVSTSAPLLQRWFADTAAPSARDPYFLYAASNLGSMLALAAYPTLLEPSLRVPDQSRYWAVGYVVFVILTVICAIAMWRSPRHDEHAYAIQSSAEEAPTILVQLHWTALALVPSSLMLGVTTYLSTDIAPIPFIWVVPLALYLLSFILVFANLPAFVHQLVLWLLPVVLLLQILVTIADISPGIRQLMVLHLVTLFLVAMACHGELARRRPVPRYLTGYYLWMSLGGVLGGMFNALVAPQLFQELTEYSLMLAAACVFLPARSIPADESQASLFGRLTSPWRNLRRWWVQGRTAPLLDVALPVLLGVGCYFLWDAYYYNRGRGYLEDLQAGLRKVAEYFGRDGSVITYSRVSSIVIYGIPIFVCYLFAARPVRFGLALGALLLANTIFMHNTEDRDVIHRTRSFFGVFKVERIDAAAGEGYHTLTHGTTWHGMQACQNNAPEHDSDPLSYFHFDSPIGQVFRSLRRAGAVRPVALVGLGAGTLAAYGQPGQEVTFFEIDPAVERIARNPQFFSYLADAEKRGVNLRVQIGDARLSLRKSPDRHYQLIVIDAFNSDAIPVHLITREAIQLYFDKLAPGGIAAFHISNRYLDLEPVLANLAEAEGLHGGLVQHDEEGDFDHFGSTWVLLARREEDFRDLCFQARGTIIAEPCATAAIIAADAPWVQLSILNSLQGFRPWYRLGDDRYQKTRIDRSKVGVWTDDYSNVFSIFAWQ